jgi:hypothetical protein
MLEVHATLTARSIFVHKGRVAIFFCNVAKQFWIDAEFLLAAMQLLPAAQHNLCTAIHDVHMSANLNVLVDQGSEIADILGVPVQAENEEVAVGIACLRAAYVQEARLPGGMNYAVDMRRNADILARIPRGLIGLDATPLGRDARLRGQQDGPADTRKTHLPAQIPTVASLLI